MVVERSLRYGKCKFCMESAENINSFTKTTFNDVFKSLGSSTTSLLEGWYENRVPTWLDEANSKFISQKSFEYVLLQTFTKELKKVFKKNENPYSCS